VLRHTIPYHTIPYHTIPYHTIPYHTTTATLRPDSVIHPSLPILSFPSHERLLPSTIPLIVVRLYSSLPLPLCLFLLPSSYPNPNLSSFSRKILDLNSCRVPLLHFPSPTLHSPFARINSTQSTYLLRDICPLVVLFCTLCGDSLLYLPSLLSSLWHPSLSPTTSLWRVLCSSLTLSVLSLLLLH
jgi:hypothetical protein